LDARYRICWPCGEMLPDAEFAATDWDGNSNSCNACTNYGVF
jgi:hypothetical protein